MPVIWQTVYIFISSTFRDTRRLGSARRGDPGRSGLQIRLGGRPCWSVNKDRRMPCRLSELSSPWATTSSRPESRCAWNMDIGLIPNGTSLRNRPNRSHQYVVVRYRT
jgi:hypothetical protein